MNRREFISAAAVLALPALPVVPSIPDPLMLLRERGWSWGIKRDPQTMWWTMLVQFKPTGVRYGYVVATTYFLDHALTPEELLARLLSRIDPYYAS